MIPLRDLNPTGSRPVLTYAILGINVLVFLGTMVDLGEAARCFGAVAAHYSGAIDPDQLTLERVRLPSGRVIEQLVDASGVPYIEPEPGWWTRTLTHMFVHGSFLHIAGNMLFLWVFADNIEDRFGRGWFLVTYFGAGLVALLAQIISQPSFGGPMVGASGAVAGVLGAYLKLFPRAKVVGLVPLGFFFFTVVWSAAVFLGLWIGMQFLNVFLGGGGGVAWWAHIGGFGFGYAIAAVLLATGKVTTPALAGEHWENAGSFGRPSTRRPRFPGHFEPSPGQRPSEGPYGTYGGIGRGTDRKITLRDLFRRY